MGKRIDRSSEAETSTTGGTLNSSTETAKSGGRTGRGRGAKAAEEKELPRVVAVEIPGSDKEEPEKPKRGRPAGSTTKKKAPAAKKNVAGINPLQISILLKTVTDIAAARPGMEIWKLSQEEVDQISKPLAEIMKRHEAIGNVTSEYADYIALITVCMTLFIPRYMMWRAMNPKKAKQKEGAISYGKPVPATRNEPVRHEPTGQAERGIRQSNGQAPNDVSSFGGQLSQFLSPLG